MTLQQLKYVSVVAQCGSFSKAAQRLYVSQPSISNLVHALEEELGLTIFLRSAGGISITGEGRELLMLGNRLLQDADYIGDFFHADQKRQRPSFFVSSQHYDFVISAFEDFVKRLDAGQYTLGLSQTQTAFIIENVRKQYSNLGVIFLSDVNRKHMERTLSDNNLEFHSLVKTAPHIFVSPTHPLADRTVVCYEDLDAYPCIVYEQNSESPGFFSEEMLLPNFYPKKVIYISDLYVSACLLNGLNAYDVGTGLLSPRLAGRFVSVPIQSDDVVEVGWIGLRDRTPSPLEESFLDCLNKRILSILPKINL